MVPDEANMADGVPFAIPVFYDKKLPLEESGGSKLLKGLSLKVVKHRGLSDGADCYSVSTDLSPASVESVFLL